MHHSSHPKKKKSKCSKHSSRIIKKESHYVFPSSQVSVPHNLLKRPLLWLKNSKSAYCVVQVYIIWVNGKRNLGVLNTFLCAMFIKQKKKKTVRSLMVFCRSVPRPFQVYSNICRILLQICTIQSSFSHLISGSHTKL